MSTSTKNEEGMILPGILVQAAALLYFLFSCPNPVHLVPDQSDCVNSSLNGACGVTAAATRWPESPEIPQWLSYLMLWPGLSNFATIYIELLTRIPVRRNAVPWMRYMHSSTKLDSDILDATRPAIEKIISACRPFTCGPLAPQAISVKKSVRRMHSVRNDQTTVTPRAFTYE